MKKFSEFLVDRDNEILQYVEYVADRDACSLQEAARRSMARAYKLVTSSDHPMAIMTAFRGERPININRVLNKELEQDLRSNGWGFIPVLGGTNERVKDPETGKETGEVKKIDGEESYFIIGKNKETFKKDVLDLVKKYNQEGAVINYGDNSAYLLTQSGETHPLGKWNLSQLSQYWTRLKHGPKNRQVSFESFDFIAAGDSSRTTKMIIDKTFS